MMDPAQLKHRKYTNVVQTAAPPEWMTTVTLCAAPARGGDCVSDHCTASPPEGLATQACVSKEGEHPCPGGGYSARTVYHRSVDDARSCQGCNCNGATSCDAQAFAHDSGSCGDTGQPLPFGDCVDISVSNSYGVWRRAWINGTAKMLVHQLQHLD